MLDPTIQIWGAKNRNGLRASSQEGCSLDIAQCEATECRKSSKYQHWKQQHKISFIQDTAHNNGTNSVQIETAKDYKASKHLMFRPHGNGGIQSLTRSRMKKPAPQGLHDAAEEKTLMCSQHKIYDSKGRQQRTARSTSKLNATITRKILSLSPLAFSQGDLRTLSRDGSIEQKTSSTRKCKGNNRSTATVISSCKQKAISNDRAYHNNLLKTAVLTCATLPNLPISSILDSIDQRAKKDDSKNIDGASKFNSLSSLTSPQKANRYSFGKGKNSKSKAQELIKISFKGLSSNSDVAHSCSRSIEKTHNTNICGKQKQNTCSLEPPSSLAPLKQIRENTCNSDNITFVRGSDRDDSTTKSSHIDANANNIQKAHHCVTDYTSSPSLLTSASSYNPSLIEQNPYNPSFSKHSPAQELSTLPPSNNNIIPAFPFPTAAEFLRAYDNNNYKNNQNIKTPLSSIRLKDVSIDPQNICINETFKTVPPCCEQKHSASFSTPELPTDESLRTLANVSPVTDVSPSSSCNPSRSPLSPSLSSDIVHEKSLQDHNTRLKELSNQVHNELNDSSATYLDLLEMKIDDENDSKVVCKSLSTQLGQHVEDGLTPMNATESWRLGLSLNSCFIERRRKKELSLSQQEAVMQNNKPSPFPTPPGLTETEQTTTKTISNINALDKRNYDCQFHEDKNESSDHKENAIKELIITQKKEAVTMGKLQNERTNYNATVPKQKVPITFNSPLNATTTLDCLTKQAAISAEKSILLSTSGEKKDVYFPDFQISTLKGNEQHPNKSSKQCTIITADAKGRSVSQHIGNLSQGTPLIGGNNESQYALKKSKLIDFLANPTTSVSKHDATLQATNQTCKKKTNRLTQVQNIKAIGNQRTRKKILHADTACHKDANVSKTLLTPEDDKRIGLDPNKFLELEESQNSIETQGLLLENEKVHQKQIQGNSNIADISCNKHEISILSKSDPDNTLIIWDWDDTFLPTYYLAMEYGCCIEETQRVPEPVRAWLRALEQKALKNLEVSLQNGRTIFITNASYRWLADSATKFFPALWNFVQQRHITILSARDICQNLTHLVQTDWKRLLIQDQIEMFFSHLDVPSCIVQKALQSIKLFLNKDENIVKQDLMNILCCNPDGSNFSQNLTLSKTTLHENKDDNVQTTSNEFCNDIDFYIHPDIPEATKLDRFCRIVAASLAIHLRVMAMTGLLLQQDQDGKKKDDDSEQQRFATAVQYADNWFKKKNKQTRSEKLQKILNKHQTKNSNNDEVDDDQSTAESSNSSQNTNNSKFENYHRSNCEKINFLHPREHRNDCGCSFISSLSNNEQLETRIRRKSSEESFSRHRLITTLSNTAAITAVRNALDNQDFIKNESNSSNSPTPIFDARGEYVERLLPHQIGLNTYQSTLSNASKDNCILMYNEHEEQKYSTSLQNIWYSPSYPLLNNIDQNNSDNNNNNHPSSNCDIGMSVLKITRKTREHSLVIPAVPVTRLGNSEISKDTLLKSTYPYAICPEGRIIHIKDMFPSPPKELSLKEIPCSVISIGDGESEREAALVAMTHWDINHREVVSCLTELRNHLYYDLFLPLIQDLKKQQNNSKSDERNFKTKFSTTKISDADSNKYTIQPTTAVMTNNQRYQVLQAPSIAWRFKSLKLTNHPSLQELYRTHEVLHVSLPVLLNLDHSVDAVIGSSNNKYTTTTTSKHSSSTQTTSSSCSTKFVFPQPTPDSLPPVVTT